MIVAQFVFGPFDGKRLILPCDPEDPWGKFVIPNWVSTDLKFLISNMVDFGCLPMMSTHR